MSNFVSRALLLIVKAVDRQPAGSPSTAPTTSKPQRPSAPTLPLSVNPPSGATAASQ